MKRYRERERILTSPLRRQVAATSCWTGLSLFLYFIFYFFKSNLGSISSFFSWLLFLSTSWTDGRSDMGGEKVFCSASLSNVFSLFSLSDISTLDIIREASHFYSSCIFVFLVRSAAWRDDLSPLFFYLFFLCASPTDFCVIMADRRAKKKHLEKVRGMNDQSY